MNIFKQIKNSIYGPEYYKSTVLAESFRASIKYLLKISFLFALLGAIFFIVVTPVFYNTLKTIVQSEVANYPDDLVISIKDGSAKVNKPEPYAIKMSSASEGLNGNNSPKLDNLMVINTTKPFDIDSFRSYSTVVLLTKTDLVMLKDDKGSIQILPLSKMGNTEIVKSSLLELESKFIKFLPFIIAFIVLFVYIGIFIGYFIGTLIMLLLYAFFIWLLGKLRGVDLTYQKSYQVGIHASTVIMILSILAVFIPVLEPFFIKLVAILLVVYINLFPDTQKQEKVEIPA